MDFPVLVIIPPQRAGEDSKTPAERIERADNPLPPAKTENREIDQEEAAAGGNPQ